MDLPVIVGEPIAVLYVKMDGAGVPVVKKETAGREGTADGQQAHTREVKLGCVFTQTKWDKQGYPIRDPDSTTYMAPSRQPKSLESGFIWKRGIAGGTGRKRKL